MAANIVSVPNSAVSLTSGVATNMYCEKLLMYFSVAGNMTIRAKSGQSVTINSVAGLVILDIQFDMVTWTGTATAAGLYTQ